MRSQDIQPTESAGKQMKEVRQKCEAPGKIESTTGRAENIPNIL